jgi:hypothetical protein
MSEKFLEKNVLSNIVAERKQIFTTILASIFVFLNTMSKEDTFHFSLEARNTSELTIGRELKKL